MGASITLTAEAKILLELEQLWLLRVSFFRHPGSEGNFAACGETLLVAMEINGLSLSLNC